MKPKFPTAYLITVACLYVGTFTYINSTYSDNTIKVSIADHKTNITSFSIAVFCMLAGLGLHKIRCWNYNSTILRNQEIEYRNKQQNDLRMKEQQANEDYARRQKLAKEEREKKEREDRATVPQIWLDLIDTVNSARNVSSIIFDRWKIDNPPNKTPKLCPRALSYVYDKCSDFGKDHFAAYTELTPSKEPCKYCNNLKCTCSTDLAQHVKEYSIKLKQHLNDYIDQLAHSYKIDTTDPKYTSLKEHVLYHIFGLIDRSKDLGHLALFYSEFATSPDSSKIDFFMDQVMTLFCVEDKIHETAPFKAFKRDFGRHVLSKIKQMLTPKTYTTNETITKTYFDPVTRQCFTESEIQNTESEIEREERAANKQEDFNRVT